MRIIAALLRRPHLFRSSSVSSFHSGGRSSFTGFIEGQPRLGRHKSKPVIYFLLLFSNDVILDQSLLECFDLFDVGPKLKVLTRCQSQF